MTRIREQAERDYQDRMEEPLSWSAQQELNRRKTQRLHAYCRLRTDGESHADLCDEYGQEAEEFRVEFEKREAEYLKSMGRAA